MWTPPSCLLMLVAVRAAPAVPGQGGLQGGQGGRAETGQWQDSVVAEPGSVVKRSARVASFLDIPETGFSCHLQDSPGIFADQETGCQVFHYCQPDGRADSFFCPNLTLFNQQYFVCDWEYNVDCGQALQFYPLNRELFATLPAQPQTARTGQTDLLGAASSSAVSRTLSTLANQLAASTSGLVQPSFPRLEQTGTGRLDHHSQGLELQGLRNAEHGGQPVVGAGDPEGLAGAGQQPASGLLASFLPRLGKAAGTDTALPALSPPAPVLPPPSSSTTAPISLDPYNDALADPEPYPGATPQALEAAGYLPASPTLSGIATTIPDQPSYKNLPYSNNPYNDFIADPEPYPGATPKALYAAGPAATPLLPVTPPALSSVSAPLPYSSLPYSNDPYNDSVADPEPYPGATREALAAANLPLYYPQSRAGSAPAPAPLVFFSNGQPTQAQSAASVDSYNDAVADPEPYPGATPQALKAAGLALPSYASAANSAAYSANPAPSTYALPSPLSSLASAFSAATTYTFSPNSADPEPTPILSTNTIDLSSAYDDSPADPEPDPNSYGVLPAQGSYSHIPEYYRALPGQGILGDSSDPEPISNPQFLP